MGGDLFNDIMSLGAHTIVKVRMYEPAYCRINGRGDLFDDILALRAIQERGAKLFLSRRLFYGDINLFFLEIKRKHQKIGNSKIQKTKSFSENPTKKKRQKIGNSKIQKI